MLRNFHWKVTLFCMIGLALTITFADQACATWIRPYVAVSYTHLRPTVEKGYHGWKDFIAKNPDKVKK